MTTYQFKSTDLIVPYTLARSLQSADQARLDPPKVKTKKSRGVRAFFVVAPRLWNELPLNIRQASSLPIF